MKMQTKQNLQTGLLAGAFVILLVAIHNSEPFESQATERREELVRIETLSNDVTPEVIEIKLVTPVKEEIVERTSLGEYTITAYCACELCCGQWADGITYTGTVATEGRTIAVDPGVIPLGSVVEIHGSEYIAEDIGGAIDGNHIDIFFNSHEDAVEWGVQEYEVYLITK